MTKTSLTVEVTLGESNDENDSANVVMSFDPKLTRADRRRAILHLISATGSRFFPSPMAHAEAAIAVGLFSEAADCGDPECRAHAKPKVTLDPDGGTKGVEP